MPFLDVEDYIATFPPEVQQVLSEIRQTIHAAVPDGDEALAAELKPYVAGKGTLKFPLDRPIPYALIGRAAAHLAGVDG